MVGGPCPKSLVLWEQRVHAPSRRSCRGAQVSCHHWSVLWGIEIIPKKEKQNERATFENAGWTARSSRRPAKEGRHHHRPIGFHKKGGRKRNNPLGEPVRTRSGDETTTAQPSPNAFGQERH